MKSILYLLLFSLYICKEPNFSDEDITHITFLDKEVLISNKKALLSDTAVVIENPGTYMVTGSTEEGNIVIKSSSVQLYLHNLFLSSKKTAPIIITSDLENVEIINVLNSTLEDLEDSSTTEGECAVVKIKKNTKVFFKNKDTFKLYGQCKNIIRGGSKTTIIFEDSNGEYILNGNKTIISSDGSLEFRGGRFNVFSEYGDAIVSKPDDLDTESLGKILIHDGIFNVHSYKDAFTAKNNIIILKGKFDVKTQNGVDDDDYNKNISSKGFKVTSDKEGAEIKVYSGEFFINTVDDAFRSNRDISLLSGKFTIYTKDDGICAKFNLTLGIKDAPLEDLNIKIIESYEAIEGMKVSIYSGKIIATADDDGINASGVIKKERKKHNRTNITRDNDTNINDTNRHKRNRTQDTDFTRHSTTPGNDSYCISIYGGEIYVFTDSDGIDSNGNLYIHGGNINIFSEGTGANEPIDHNGNFTLYNADILGVGTKGLEAVHAGIEKGNQMYAFHMGVINKNKLIEVKNEKNETVKQGSITKNINYIFYTSSKLNENYSFYIYDLLNDNNTKLNMTFAYPQSGEDDEDIYYNYQDNINNDNDNGKDENKNKNEEKSNKTNYLSSRRVAFLAILLLVLL